EGVKALNLAAVDGCQIMQDGWQGMYVQLTDYQPQRQRVAADRRIDRRQLGVAGRGDGGQVADRRLEAHQRQRLGEIQLRHSEMMDIVFVVQVVSRGEYEARRSGQLAQVGEEHVDILHRLQIVDDD